MTDIVEQAARVLTNELHHTANPYDLAQALADAGLLAEPARTVPTREEIAEALFQWNTPDDPHFVIYGRSGDDSGGNAYYPIADAILALLADQPTVDGARPWEHEGHKPVQHRDGKPPWCRECGYTSPAPAIPARQIRDGK